MRILGLDPPVRPPGFAIRTLEIGPDQVSCRDKLRVPGCSQTIWFAPGECEAEELLKRGVQRGRIWTSAELAELWKTPGHCVELARNLARLRIASECRMEPAGPAAKCREIDPPRAPPSPKESYVYGSSAEANRLRWKWLKPQRSLELIEKTGGAMKVSEAFPSKYLKAADLNGHQVEVTIREVRLEEVGTADDTQQRPVLYFKNKDKGLVLNKTNGIAIANELGDETDDWPGKTIILTCESVNFKGNFVDAIRVRIPKPQSSTVDPEDDDVPF
jgi:hypothetical protein